MPHIVVVGGGITGLAAAWRLTRDGPGGAGAAGSAGVRPEGLRVTVVEAAPRFGGKIVTERAGGFLIDGGADSFASRKPRGVGLVRELGLGGSLVATGSGAKERPDGRAGGAATVHVLRGGRLVPMPAGLSLVVPTRAGPVLRSPLLSLRGKLRLALDLVLPGRAHLPNGDGGEVGESGNGLVPDESVADLIRRRFGTEYLDRLAGPLLAGIHSTDPEDLSVAAAFPHLAAMERRHRSLLLAVRRNGGRSPAAGSRSVSGPGLGPGSGQTADPPSPDTAAARVGLLGGMGELVDALVSALERAGVALRAGQVVRALERRPGGGWTVRVEGGEAPICDGAGHGAGDRAGDRAPDRAAALEADAVILAAPPAGVASLLDRLEPRLAAGLRAIPHVSSSTVALGYPRAAVARPLVGMGFLVPRGEPCLLGACTFASEKFPGRAPEGHVLLRAFVGEAGDGLADDELADLVHGELRRLFGLTAEPVLARVQRFREANPRYRVGHLERVGTIERITPPGLVLAGCAYHGLGVPDCIASGERAAGRALEAALP